jgi:pyridoxal phosphate enzyme (YggS family)
MPLNPMIPSILQSLGTAKLVAATKTFDAAMIRELATFGVWDVGENRVQDMLAKQDALTDLPLRWHFIGHLQTNKVPSMINRIVCLHSLDSLKLAQSIQKHRKGVLDCFVEVNVALEDAKSGIAPEETISFVESLANYDTIRVIGLMGMGPASGDGTATRRAFATLKKLKLEVASRNFPFAPCTELSMGMSGDYRIALEEGSTCVRLGSILTRNEE